MDTTHATEASAKDVVLGFLNALNAGDLDRARTFVTDDLHFVGPLGSREGADVYFREMAHLRFQYRVHKVFAGADDVCVIYDVVMQGTAIYSCGWYRLVGGKINWFRVVFDPRPVLKS